LALPDTSVAAATSCTPVSTERVSDANDAGCWRVRVVVVKTELPTPSALFPGLALPAYVPSAPPGRGAQTPPMRRPGRQAPGAPPTSTHQLALPPRSARHQPTSVASLSSAPLSRSARLVSHVTGTVAWVLPSTEARLTARQSVSGPREAGATPKSLTFNMGGRFWMQWEGLYARGTTHQADAAPAGRAARQALPIYHSSAGNRRASLSCGLTKSTSGDGRAGWGALVAVKPSSCGVGKAR